MKILVLSSQFPNLIGGVSDYTYFLSSELARKKVDVTVLTTKCELIQNKKSNSFEVLASIDNWSFLELPKIVKEIKRIKPDCILLQYVPYMYSSIGIPIQISLLVILIKIHGFKLVTTFHEIAIRINLNNPKSILIGFAQRLCAYVIAAMSDSIVLSIEKYRKMLVFINKKIFKVPVGSNIMPYNMSESEKLSFRRKIAKDNEYIMCNFGVQIKVDILIEILKYSSNTEFPLKFLLIGKYPESFMNDLNQKIEENDLSHFIYYTGYVEPKEVYAFLYVSDLFLKIWYTDSRDMGGVSAKSGALAAAYATGLPVIGNKGDLTDDFYVDLENILFINPMNVHEIFNKIKMILKNSDIYQQLKKGSKNTYNSKLTWSSISNHYIEILNGL